METNNVKTLLGNLKKPIIVIAGKTLITYT